MPERPPTNSNESHLLAAEDALLDTSQRSLEIEQRIADALKRANLNNASEMVALEGMFEEARVAARNASKAFAEWKKALQEKADSDSG